MQLERRSRVICCVVTVVRCDQRRSEVLGSGYGHCDVLRAPSKHSTGPRASRAMVNAMTLVRLGDPCGHPEAQRYTQPTSDIAQRRGPAIRKAHGGSNSHSARYDGTPCTLSTWPIHEFGYQRRIAHKRDPARSPSDRFLARVRMAKSSRTRIAKAKR